MSLAEIEIQLQKLDQDELRRLALKAWAAYLEREGVPGCHQWADEDPEIIASLDAAMEKCCDASRRTYTGDEVRAHISQWSSK